MDEMMRLALEMPEEMGRPPHDVHDKDGLMRFGQEVAEVCDGEVRDHKATVDRWAKHSASVGDLMRVALCFKADYQVLTSSAAEWAVDGFPSVVLGAKYAAALCATSVPEELTKDLRCPWPSWVLEVPDGLLKYKSVFEGHEATVRRLLISQFPRPNSELRWDWTAFTNDGTSVFQFGLKTKPLVEREKDGGSADEDGQATAELITGSSPKGVPGRGLRKLSGTSWGSSSPTWTAEPPSWWEGSSSACAWRWRRDT